MDQTEVSNGVVHTGNFAVGVPTLTTTPRGMTSVDVKLGVELMGDGEVADLLWARPSATVIGIDVPPVVGSSAAVQASAAARVSLRLPPGMTGQQAQDALVAHPQARVPWGLHCEIEHLALAEAQFLRNYAGAGR